MTNPGRLAAALAVAAVCAALPFARTTLARTTGSSDRTQLTASFSGMGLSFRYPASWQRATWSDEVSSFAVPIVSLSTGQQRQPCIMVTVSGGQALTCGDPVEALAPGGVLVSWDADGFPGFDLRNPNVTVAGRPALQTTSTDDGWCAALGGTEGITVLIPRHAPYTWYQMNACLRGPGLAPQKAEISAMLRTVQIADSD